MKEAEGCRKCYEEERRSRRSRKMQKERKREETYAGLGKEAAEQKLTTPMKRKTENIHVAS